LVRLRASRNPNEIIEKQATFGERVADNTPYEVRLTIENIGGGDDWKAGSSS